MARVQFDTNWSRRVTAVDEVQWSAGNGHIELVILGERERTYSGALLSRENCVSLAMVLGGSELRNLVRMSTQLAGVLEAMPRAGEEGRALLIDDAAKLVAHLAATAHPFHDFMPEED